MDTRTLDDIKLDLAATAERRSRLWKELSLASDPEKSAEVARLNQRLEELWMEARQAKNRARFGSKDAIVRRARAEERLERDLAKVA